MKDEENVVPAAMKNITSSVAGNIVKGNVQDITKTKTPIFLHHHFSQLCLLKNDQSFCKYIKLASESQDPVERLKLLVTYQVPCLFINPTLLQCRKPLDPIIGETYQCEMPTGEKLFVEQISASPDITYFSLEGPEGSYHMYGHYTLKGWVNGPNSLAGSKKGDITLKLKDGTTYKFENPLMIIHNLVTRKN